MSTAIVDSIVSAQNRGIKQNWHNTDSSHFCSSLFNLFCLYSSCTRNYSDFAALLAVVVGLVLLFIASKVGWNIWKKCTVTNKVDSVSMIFALMMICIISDIASTTSPIYCRNWKNLFKFLCKGNIPIYYNYLTK